jgi:hypothetical protein
MATKGLIIAIEDFYNANYTCFNEIRTRLPLKYPKIIGKRNVHQILLIKVLYVFNYNLPAAQWYPTNGPGGCSVNDIKKIGNRLFFGSGEIDPKVF